MGPRISMAQYAKLDKVQSDCGVNGIDPFKVGQIFEAGMIEVLREIAVLKLLEFESKKWHFPKEYSLLVEEQSTLHRQIFEALPEDKEGLMDKHEDLSTRIAGYESDALFVEGFIAGYRFLRTTNSSYLHEIPTITFS